MLTVSKISHKFWYLK